MKTSSEGYEEKLKLRVVLCVKRRIVQHVWAVSEYVSVVPQGQKLAELRESRAAEEEMECTSIFLMILRI